MRKKHIYTFLIICVILLFFVGCDVRCDDCPEGRYIPDIHFLVNKSGNSLHYSSQYESYSNGQVETLLFDTTLNNNDTLLLYKRRMTLPGIQISDSAHYFSDSLIIKDSRQIVFFIRSKTLECGEEDFVKKEIDKNNDHYYWTIDSAYIADKSCNMSVEELEEEDWDYE